MKRAVRFLAAAEAEIDEAIVWYENQSQGLGAEFARALRVAELAVMRDAGRFPVLYVAESGRQVRRVLLRRFPYSVHYLLEADTVVVLACLHGRRDPKNRDRS